MEDVKQMLRAYEAPTGFDSSRLIDGALHEGVRRRRRRAVVRSGVAALAVIGVLGSGIAVSQLGDSAGTTGEVAGPTGGDVGSGPVERVADDRLVDTARALMPSDDVRDASWSPTDVTVVGSDSRARDNRTLTLTYRGAQVSMGFYRWRAAATRAEDGDSAGAHRACRGVGELDPEQACTRLDGGWGYGASPSQGPDGNAGGAKENQFNFYSDTGFIVVISAYNTPAEKALPPVADEPVLSMSELRTVASSPRWFTRS